MLNNQLIGGGGYANSTRFSSLQQQRRVALRKGHIETAGAHCIRVGNKHERTGAESIEVSFIC